VSLPGPSVVTLQLVLVRSLFDRALHASREGSDVSLMSAMLLADIAVETVVKQALFDRGIDFGRQDKLGALLDTLVKQVPSLDGRPEVGAARRLREARNPVQHAGQVPSRSSVEGHLRDAELFLAVITRECFSVELSSLSPASLIKADDLRTGLASAAEWLRDGQLDEANVCLAATFDVLGVALRHWLRRARGKDARKELFAGVWLHETIIAVFGPEHGAATETRLEENPDNDEAYLAVQFPLADVLRLQRLGKRALEFLRATRDKKPEVGAPPPATDIEAGIDSLAKQIARLEAAQPDLFVPLPTLIKGETEAVR